MTVKNIIWDCDGVLVDSEKIAMRVAAEIVHEELLAHNRPGVNIDQFVIDYAGKHFSHMLADVGLSDPDGRLDGIKMQRTIEDLTKNVETFAGLREAMQTLKGQGVRMAVATSSELSRVLPCLEKHGLIDFFKDGGGVLHVYSAMDSLSPPALKPEPDIYLHALTKLGALAQDSIAVEDSPSGATSAVRAGLRVLGFIGAGHIPETMKETHAEKLLGIGVTSIFQNYDSFAAHVKALSPLPVQALPDDNARLIMAEPPTLTL